MNRTLHFKFPLYNNNDKPSILNDYNSTITEIDRVLYALSIATGDSDEYERKLDELQQDLIELTTIVDEHGKDLTEISQTIATILGSVSALSVKVDGYDDRINNINTRLNNVLISISKKFDTRSENDLPSQPIYDSDNSVYYVKVPYCPTTQEESTVPQEILPYGMNSSGFIWYGWRIIEFRIYKDNDESKELLSVVSLSPNDMVRVGFMKQMTTIYDEEAETEVELWFWVLNFSPIINVQNSIENSTYYRVHAPYNSRIPLSTATKGRTGFIRTVWFTNPCTVYWRDSQNETVEVEVVPYKLYTALQGYQNNGSFLQEVYGESDSDLSVLQRIKGYGPFDYVPYNDVVAGEEVMQGKQFSISAPFSVVADSNKFIRLVNSNNVICSFTLRDLIENPDLSTPWTFNRNTDRLYLQQNIVITIPLSTVTTTILNVMQNYYYKDEPNINIYASISGYSSFPIAKATLRASENDMQIVFKENISYAGDILYGWELTNKLPADIDTQIDLTLSLNDIGLRCESVDTTAVGDFNMFGSLYIGLQRFN